jgi:hypothetical protein
LTKKLKTKLKAKLKPAVDLTNEPVFDLTNEPVLDLINEPAVDLPNDPIVEIHTSQHALRTPATFKSIAAKGAKIAALVGMAYYSQGNSFAIKHIALPLAAETAKYAQFLYPIWGESIQVQEARMQIISSAVQNGSLVFKSFYVDFPETFITLPPANYSHLFHPIELPFSNSISAHIKLFTNQLIVEKVAAEILSNK